MASTAHPSDNPPNLRASFAAFYRTLVHDLFGDYRPELHYMRGPGPKWREKHGASAQAAPPLFQDTVPA